MKDITFVYTFAAPNTTTASASITSQYKNIFNMVNADDIIAEMPLSGWEFRKYGVMKAISVGEKLNKEWGELTNEKYKYNIAGKNELLHRFDGLSDSRDGCYEYTCSCHGDGSDDGKTVDVYTSKNGSPQVLYYGESYCKITYRGISIGDSV